MAEIGANSCYFTLKIDQVNFRMFDNEINIHDWEGVFSYRQGATLFTGMPWGEV